MALGTKKLIKSVVGMVCLLTATWGHAADPYKPTVESLQHYQCPECFRDAKLGICLHWGAYSVVERGEWYARKLYGEGGEDYVYHLEHYGHPSEFGYKDFMPLWKAENFDPDVLLALFRRAGAKYLSPRAVHHDNFVLWDSKHHHWNAVAMGPKRDIVDAWRDATLKAGLRFGVTTHLSRSCRWLNVANQSDTEGAKKGVPYDGGQGGGKGLYPPNDGQSTHPRAPLKAPKAWRDHWRKRLEQLIDDYQPGHLYFDCAVPFRGDDNGQTGMDVIAHFYNARPEGVMCAKERPWQGLYTDGMTTLDYERGKASHILAEPWQTDDSIGSWGYNGNKPDATSDLQIDKFVDIVSKSGNLLLNIPIRADGALDNTATQTARRAFRVLHWTRDTIGALAGREQHHPDLHLVSYREVWVEIYTHAIGGLSEDDFILAPKIDAVAPPAPS